MWPEKSGMRICKNNNSADTKVTGKGGQEVLQALLRFLCSPGEAQPLQPVGIQGCRGLGGDPCLERRLGTHGKPLLEQAPGRTCDLVVTGAGCA